MKKIILLTLVLTSSILAKDYGYDRVNRTHYDFDKTKSSSLGELNMETKEFIIHETNRILINKFNISYPKTVKKEFNKYNSTIVNKVSKKIEEKINNDNKNFDNKFKLFEEKMKKLETTFKLLTFRTNNQEETINKLNQKIRKLMANQKKPKYSLEELKSMVKDKLNKTDKKTKDIKEYNKIIDNEINDNKEYLEDLSL